MKIERQLCDLCGGTIVKKDGGYAVLTVPDFDGTAKPKKASADNPFMISLEFVINGVSSASKTYDVCRGCCEGLLKARAYIRHAALERIFATEDEPA